MNVTIATGQAAVDWFETHGIGQLCKHADPVTGVREGLCPDEAQWIAKRAPDLLYLQVPSAEVRRLVPDTRNHAELWWETFRRSLNHGLYPRKLRPLRDELEQLADLDPEVILPRRWAAEILAWAATLPGWSTGPAHARFALLCQGVN